MKGASVMNLQLYSVKDQTQNDFAGTLEKVAKMGYTGVEFAGYGGISAADMKALLDSFGLTAVSSHVGYDLLKNGIEKEIEYLNVLGAKYIVCPGTGDLKTVDAAKRLAVEFSEWGEKAKAGGLIFGYHNHDFELKADDGQYPLEVMFENADAGLVKMQPDVYWVAYAGLDPIAFVKKHLSRIPIIHLKQIKDMETKENVDAGSGIIDFKALMTNIAPNADYVYEQEHFKTTSLEEVEKSARYFNS
jgi:sugar phosphate isomerase/epimerase